MQHLLAYGQSDQASFRDSRVEACYDAISVPGTIASYFEDATAAFVLTLNKPYLIDPRTPLFQDSLGSPRKSHLTLAEWHGPSVAGQIASAGTFPSSFYTTAVVAEMVTEIVGRQRAYGSKAAGIAPKMNRYLKLLAQARGEPEVDTASDQGPSPDSVLLPYFAVKDLTGGWWPIMQDIWQQAGTLSAPNTLRPVVCVGGRSWLQDVDLLDSVLAQSPTALSSDILFWVTNFDERLVDQQALERMWEVVATRTKTGLSLTNLYGGFFSICLGLAGLSAFGNGLGYSESRQWPALDATGAAPARYYLRDLHVFAPPATADQIVNREPAFQCPCEVCAGCRAAGRSIVGMDYPDLKIHFALARQWEMSLVANQPKATIATQLRQANTTYNAINLPPGVRVGVAHLTRWASVLDAV